MRIVSRLGLVGLALALIQCSSSSGSSGSSCGKVEPCGGDPVGTWKPASTCVNSMALTSLIEGDAGADAGATCAGITFTAGSASRTGSDVFNSDMTYEVTGTGTAHVNVFYPASCLGGETCAEVSSQLGAQAGFSSVSCTGTGSCTCAAVVTVPLADTGTYTVSGNTLNLDSTTSGPSTQSFCVQGDTLHLVDIDTTMNMGPMGMATIDDDDVLTKQ